MKKPLIVFCHGSGDTGLGVKAWVQSLVSRQQYEAFDWLFPTAKPIPYALNGGMVSSVWYDRIGGFDPTFPEHTASVEQSTSQLIAVLDDQIATKGRSPGDIFLGGFSMGGAIAYQTAARWHARIDNNNDNNNKSRSLGGVFGLSCYLNDDSRVWSLLEKSAQHWPPTFVAHGASDDFILPTWGKTTFQKFQAAGIDASFRLVPHLHHEMRADEMTELLEFLNACSRKEGEEESETKQSTTTTTPSTSEEL